MCTVVFAIILFTRCSIYSAVTSSHSLAPVYLVATNDMFIFLRHTGNGCPLSALKNAVLDSIADVGSWQDICHHVPFTQAVSRPVGRELRR